MFTVKLLKKLIAVLHSNVSPHEIAAGFALGALLGFTPAHALHWYVILLFIFIVNVNIASAFLGAAVFGILALFTDPLSHTIGYAVLVTMTSLRPLWVKLSHIPLVPFTHFNNTVVMGSLLLALGLLVPAYLFMRWFVVFYRTSLQEKVMKWKLVRLFTASKVYNLYNSYQ